MNWSAAGNWQTWNGSNWVTATTYPGEIAGTGDVTIQDGHTVTIDVSPVEPITRLFVGEGTSGILQYEAATARTLSVNGIVRINPGGTFRCDPNGTVTTHQLIVDAGIVNEGTLNFSSNNAGVGITFIGSSSGIFDLSNATLTNLISNNGLVLDKGTGVLSFTPGKTMLQVLSGNAVGFLTIQSGTFSLMGENSFSNPLFYASGSYAIPSGGGFWLDNPNATIVGMYGTLTNNGQMKIKSGVYNIGTGSGNELLITSTGSFEMSGGTMNISGRFRIEGGNGVITGGSINLARVGHANQDFAAFYTSGPAGLTISGSPMITLGFPNSNTATHYNDIEILTGSGNKTITGGTFQVGTSTTPAGSTFLVNSQIPLHNLIVNNANARVSLTHDLTINNLLTLYGRLLLNNYNLTLGAPAIAGTHSASAGMIVTGLGTGKVLKMVDSNGSYTFPFGNGSAYLPVTLNFKGGSFTPGATVSVGMTADKHPNNVNTTNYLKRYWTVRTTEITNPVYDFTGTYANADVVSAVGDGDSWLTTGVFTTAWRRLSASNNIGTTIYASGLTGDADITGINSAAAAPEVTVTATPNPVCGGSPVQLATNVTGTGPFTYSWTSNPAGFTSTTANPSFSPLNTTTYTVTVTDGMGETATASVAVTVNPPLVASVSVVSSDADNIICAGQSVTFTATPTNGGTPSYRWYEGTTPVGTNSPTFTTTSLASGQPVTVVMTSTAACTTGSPATSNPITTTVNPQLPVSVSITASSNPVCAGQGVTFTTTQVNGGDDPQYEWRVNGNKAGANSAVLAYTPSNGDVVTCVLTSNALCPTGSPATSNAVTMVVHALPAASISVTREVCKDAPSPNVTFTGNSGTAPYTFTYRINNGANQTVTSTGNTATVAVSTGAPGDFVYRLVSVQDAYCSQLQTETATITVNPLPVVTISSNSPQCVGSTLTLTASGGVAYHWTGPNGYASEEPSPSISNVTTNAAGTYTVRVTDANGCVATASTSVIINPAPTISITASPSGTICRGTNMTFTTRVNNAGGNPTFQWQINEADVSGATSSTFSTTALANSQRVRVIVTADPAYCSSKATSNVITMTVNDPVTPAVSILESRNNICSGTLVTFTSLVANGGSATTYQWHVNGTNVNGATNASFSSNILNDGDQVRVIIQSNATCVTSSSATSNTVRMIVNPILTASVTITANPSIAVCPGTSVTFTASSTNAGTNPVYQWRVNNTNVGTNSPSFTTTTLANNDVVSVRMTSNALCVSEANVNSNNITVAINPGTPALPGAITGNTLVCPTTTETYTISPVANATSYTWSVPSDWSLVNGQGTNTLTVTTGNTGQNGTITVTATNSCGISGVRTLTVSTGSISTAPTGITITNNNTCSGTTKTLTVSGGSLGTGASWQWFSGSCGGTSVGTGASITANPASGTSTIYFVRASATCNTTTCAEGTVIVSPGAPDQPQAITGGASPVCPGINLTYSIPAVNNATSYNWTAPTGWNITSEQGSASITVTAGAAGQNGNISVMAINSCGSSTARTLAVTVASGIPAIPGPIAGNSDQCVNSTGRVYSIAPVPNATSYLWTAPSGWTITAGQGTNSISVSTNGTASGGNISVAARNTCGDSPANSIPVYIVTTVPATPGPINGLTAICPVKSVVYSVSPVQGAISYTWSVPNNWNISAGQGSASITVQVPSNAASGNVSVVANNVCGPSLASTLPVTVANTAWVNAGIDQVVCQGTLSVTLNGSVGGAISANKDKEWDWQASNGGTILPADNLRATYTLPNSGNIPGVYTIRILSNVSAVGCVQTQDEMTVTVMPNPNASLAITGNNPVCNGSASTITFMATPNTTVTYTINNGTNQTINVGNSGTALLNTGALTANATYRLVSVGYTAIPSCPQTASGLVTIAVNSLATVSAGQDLTICAGNTATMAGNFGGGATSGTWATSGSGSFNNINSPTAVYTPGAADVNAGNVTLTYTTDDPNGPCTAVSDAMVLTINPVAIINAGNDQTICAGSSATMNGSLGGSATSGTWTTSGTGTFSNNSSSAVYTPGAADVSAGTVTLTYTSNDPNGPCTAVSDAMVLTINPLPTVNAGPDRSVCATSAITLTGTVSGPVSTGTWSGGSGSFSNTASLNTVYTPSGEEISDGRVTLTLTSEDPAGPCGTVSDQVTITITPSATVNAGVDQDICEGSNTILRGIIGGAASSATWAGGTGTYTPNNTTLNATYQPGVNETGDVTITLTTNDPSSSCNAVSDQMIIHLYPRATVNGGPDQTICSNGTATMAGSFGGSATSGRWSTNGGGTFNNPNSASAVYTPGNSDISNGSVTLTFTSDDPDGPCGPVSDAMVLTINHAIQITSQPVNTGVCATDDATFTVSAVGDNLTYQWYRGIAPGGREVVNTSNITGAQTASLHFDHATSVDEGSYYVMISGVASCAPVPSSTVTLNVDQEITIKSQFQTTTVCVGDNITFNIEAEPGGQLTFQWRKDGVNIDGATGNTLRLDNVTLANGGSYDVVIAGMAGYTCSSAHSAAATLTVTPSVEIPVFASGATSNRCQGAGTVSYSATANNSTGITYNLDATTAAYAGNSINTSTGAITFASGWSGTTTITASAAGCKGPTTATHTVTITPTVTIAPFANSTSTRCQGAGTVTYTTSATNSTGITYSLDNASLAGGNTINANTGAVTFAAGWAGSTTITASAAGCNGPATATHTVTVTPTVTIAPFGNLPSTRCQGAGTVTYSTTATNSTGITYSLDATSITGGNTINASTGAVTFAAGWAGSTTITASAAGCNGPATATHTVTVTSTVTIAPYLPLTSTRCQGAGTVTYSTNATNSTGIIYSLDAASMTGGNTINASTGAVTFAAGWAGTTTITASAAGCNGPATATHTVTVTPTVTIAPFSPLTSTRCQGFGTVTYSTTAANSTGITYSLDAATAAFAGNSINASTGAVIFAAGWAGSTTITASAAGCNGPATATHTVTVTPTVTIAPFANLTSTRCQGAGTVTYSTTAANSAGITYRLDDASLAGGNTINASTGAVTYAAGWSGSTIITASAAGCNGPVTTTHTVITEPISVGGTISPYTQTVCTTTNSGSLTLSGHTGAILRWESSTNAGGSWTQIPNTSSTYNFSNLPLTTIFRVLVKSGACAEVYSAPARVVVIPLFEPVITATTVDICNGNSTRLSVSTSLLQPVGAFYGGSFNQANPPGWRISENGGFIGFPAAANNTTVGPWSETNGPKTFNDISYNNLDGKFAVVNGIVRSTMETPVFNLFGLPSAELTFTQAYNILPGTTARIELSTDGGNTYNIQLASYTGSLHGGNPNVINPVNIDMSPYLGMMNLRIRFNYIGTNGSSWAVEGISVPSQQTDVTYIWSPAETLSSTTDSVVIATPGTTTTYTLTMMVSGCPIIAKSIVIGVANPPTVQTTNACIGGGPVTFTQTGGTTGGNWRVTGGGTINTAGVFTPATPGCFNASYITPAGTCGDTVSFVVFPAAPTPIVNSGCGPIVVTPPAAIPGFTLQYSFDNGTTWGGNTPPTQENCTGYQIRTRYITSTICDTNPANTASTLVGCNGSPAVTRVVDFTAPVITCPATITASTNADACYATLVLTPPVVTDNCTAATAITVTSNAPAQFPVGQTIVTWTAVDACGNQSTCTQTVTITDNKQSPVFTSCPPDQEQTALPNNCVLYDIVLTEPTATDNCAVTRMTYTTTGATTLISPQTGINYVSGQDLNVGVTTITYIAYDAADNASQPCTFKVWVKDLNKPVFTVGCPVNVIQDVDAGKCTAAVTVPVPAVTDPCNEGYTLTNSFNNTNNASGNYPVGTNTIRWTITDLSGNITTCDQTITINDVLPTIVCPPTVADVIAADGCSKTDVTVGAPTFTGNCANPVLSYRLTGATTGSGSGVVPSGQAFNIGVTTVTYTVTDSHNNTTSCNFTVTIRRLNIPPPVIHCPDSPAAVTAVAGTCFAPVTVAAPVEEDPCETVSYTFINDFNHTSDASGSYPVGSTNVTWTISDNSGNTITCQQTVVVNDLPPTITCPEPNPLVVQADFEVPYQDAVTVPRPTFGDNCPNPVLTWTMVPPAAYASQYQPGTLSGSGYYPSPSMFYLGESVITYTVTDSNGNKATCSYTVTVLAEPEITCLPAVSYNTDPGQCTATRNSSAYGLPTLERGVQPITWTWTITNPDGTQGATGTYTGSQETPGPPSIADYAFRQGTSIITWRAENVSGFDECTQNVTVTDNQAPTFTVPKALTECVESLSFAVYDPATIDIGPVRPDWYILKSGSNLLDITELTDNCCAAAAMTIHWRIDLSGGVSITGIGQPSAYGSDIRLPGDVAPYDDVLVHLISFWVEDCHGQTSLVQTQNISIKPRPNLTKGN